MVDKGWVYDSRLSAKAKGILLYLLSRPDDWRVFEAEILKNFSDGRDSIRSGIKELIQFGYIKRSQKRNELGRMSGYEYEVYEVSSVDGFSDNGEPDIGKPNTTNIKVTDKEKNNIYITLPGDAHVFIPIYKAIFREHMGKSHMRVTEDQLSYILRCLEELESMGVTEEQFEQAATDHFENLPKTNSGNILAFLSAMRRYFDINNPYQELG